MAFPWLWLLCGGFTGVKLMMCMWRQEARCLQESDFFQLISGARSGLSGEPATLLQHSEGGRGSGPLFQGPCGCPVLLPGPMCSDSLARRITIKEASFSAAVQGETLYSGLFGVGYARVNTSYLLLVSPMRIRDSDAAQVQRPPRGTSWDSPYRLIEQNGEPGPVSRIGRGPACFT